MKYYLTVEYEYDWGADLSGGRVGNFRVSAGSEAEAISRCKDYMTKNVEDFDEDLCSFSFTEFYTIV